MTHRQRALFAAAAASMMANAFFTVILAKALGLIIDSIGSPNPSVIIRHCLAGVTIVLMEFLSYILSRRLMLSYAGSRVALDKDRHYGYLMDDSDDYGAKKPADNISMFSANPDILFGNYYANQPLLFLYVSQLALTLALMATISISLSAMTIAISLLPMAVPVIFKGRMQGAADDFSKRNSEYLDFIRQTEAGYPEIISYSQEPFFKKRHHLANQLTEFARSKYKFALSSSNALATVLGSFVFLFCIGAGAIFVHKDLITIGELITLIQLINTLVSPIGQIVSSLNEMSSAKAIKARYAESKSQSAAAPIVTSSSPAAQEQASPLAQVQITTAADDNDFDLKGSESSLFFQEAITLKNICFSYGEKAVLSNLSLKIMKGRKYAVIGKSGIGKSTLGKLLCGAITSYTGQIMMDGKDYRGIAPRSLRSIVRYVTQQPFMMEAPIKDNIAFGDAPVQTDKMDSAIETAQVREFLEEAGGRNATELSVGQQKRVAIARALYHGCSVLILDESTESLNIEVSLSIIRKLAALPELTLLLITHDKNKRILELFDEVIELK